MLNEIVYKITGEERGGCLLRVAEKTLHLLQLI